MITEKQRDLIQKKYGDLIYKISHQISGDSATCSIEDNVQDLWIAAMEAVAGFQKQNNGENGTFEDFWGSRGFDKYIKTCLWSAKNSKGKKVTKKWNLTNGNVNIFDHGDTLNSLEDDAFTFDGIIIEDFNNILNDSQREILSHLVMNPSLIFDSGSVNVSALARCVEQEPYKVKNTLESMKNRLGSLV